VPEEGVLRELLHFCEMNYEYRTKDVPHSCGQRSTDGA
jgi:hypothetical protein